MTTIRLSAFVLGLAVLAPATASAQYLVPVAPLPVVAARPVIAPVVAPVRYYAARPVVVAPTIPVVRPATVARVTYTAPVAVAARPVTTVAAPTSVVVARPVTPVVSAYYAPTVYTRPAVVRPKVYYPGQPLRNTIRAVTP